MIGLCVKQQYIVREICSVIIIIIIFLTLGRYVPEGVYYYCYYYAAFNAPFVGHKDAESQARGSRGSTGSG